MSAREESRYAVHDQMIMVLTTNLLPLPLPVGRGKCDKVTWGGNLSFRPTAGSEEIGKTGRDNSPVVLIMPGDFDPSTRSASLRMTKRVEVSFRLEYGAAIWNGGIEKTEPGQSPVVVK